MEASETIVLLAQKEVYKLIDKQALLDEAVKSAQFSVRQAIDAAEDNKKSIRECARFLQEQCPDAVKGTWFQELGLENDLMV